MVMARSEKLTPPSSTPIGGMMTSLTKDDTIFPKAVPTITPTAISITFPLTANSLNSWMKLMAALLSVDEICFSDSRGVNGSRGKRCNQFFGLCLKIQRVRLRERVDMLFDPGRRQG